MSFQHVIEQAEIDEAVAALDAIDGQDPERAHGDADVILENLAPADVKEALDRLHARARGWWYA